MNLTTEMFAEISQSVLVLSADAPIATERRSTRLRIASHLSVVPWTDPSSPLSVRVRDLSAGGVGLLHTKRMALDEELVIRFPLPNSQSVLVLATVLYWEPLSENLFAIGAQFDRIVSEAELSRQISDVSRHQEGVIMRITHAVTRRLRLAS